MSAGRVGFTHSPPPVRVLAVLHPLREGGVPCPPDLTSTGTSGTLVSTKRESERNMHARLEIKLGNEAMRSPNDVAEVLMHVVNVINGGGLGYQFEPVVTNEGMALRDVNGNFVGRFSFTEEGQ